MGPGMALLVTEIGLPIAKKIFASLSKKKGYTTKIENASSLINSGSTAIAAFQNAFGADFREAMTASISNGVGGWNYEAGRQDYVCLQFSEKSARQISCLLRDELNVNLERINLVYGSKNPELKNYFVGLFRQWQDRYIDLIGNSEDSQRTFETINSLLDGNRKTVSSAFHMLKKTGLGGVGALLIVQAAMVATSTGVGIIATLSTWTLGIPMVQVGGLVVGGAVLIGISRMDFTPTNAMSATVAIAYKLLDRQQVKDSTLP